MDRCNDLCFWVMLHLLKFVLFAVPPMRKWILVTNDFTNDFINVFEHNWRRWHIRLRSSIDIPLDIDWLFGHPGKWMGFPQRF
jgi:hypothetical protein